LPAKVLEVGKILQVAELGQRFIGRLGEITGILGPAKRRALVEIQRRQSHHEFAGELGDVVGIVGAGVRREEQREQKRWPRFFSYPA
jgi:hypothetical protein